MDILTIHIEIYITSLPLDEFTSKTFCLHDLSWYTSYTLLSSFCLPHPPVWISIAAAAGEISSQGGVQYCQTWKRQQIITSCELFCDTFLHKEFTVELVKKVRNYLEPWRLTQTLWRLIPVIWSSP
jgi:hypothetical protein